MLIEILSKLKQFMNSLDPDKDEDFISDIEKTRSINEEVSVKLAYLQANKYTLEHAEFHKLCSEITEKTNEVDNIISKHLSSEPPIVTDESRKLQKRIRRQTREQNHKA